MDNTWPLVLAILEMEGQGASCQMGTWDGLQLTLMFVTASRALPERALWSRSMDEVKDTNEQHHLIARWEVYSRDTAPEIERCWLNNSERYRND